MADQPASLIRTAKLGLGFHPLFDGSPWILSGWIDRVTNEQCLYLVLPRPQAIDRLPVIPGLMEAVGNGYSGVRRSTPDLSKTSDYNNSSWCIIWQMWDGFRIELAYNVQNLSVVMPEFLPFIYWIFTFSYICFSDDAVVRVPELAIQVWQVMKQYDYFIQCAKFCICKDRKR